jgi:SAM-dependent methyltransferase
MINTDLQDAYGARAAYYDLFAECRGTKAPPAVNFFADLTPVGARVLDVGAGTGRVTLKVADRAEQVHALEPSDAMRAILLTKLAAHRKLWPRVTVLGLAAPRFRLRRRFDYAYLAGVLQHLPPEQRPELFTTLASHIEPGSGLLALDMVSGAGALGWPDRQVEEVSLGACTYTLHYSAIATGPDRQEVRLTYHAAYEGRRMATEVVEHERYLHRSALVASELEAAGFVIVGGSAFSPDECGATDGGTIVARYDPEGIQKEEYVT